MGSLLFRSSLVSRLQWYPFQHVVLMCEELYHRQCFHFHLKDRHRWIGASFQWEGIPDSGSCSREGSNLGSIFLEYQDLVRGSL